MNNDSLLVVKGLKKFFPLGKGFLKKSEGYVQAVNGVDLSIKRGETLGLVGESGCGKSTLGRCILRLEEPSEGKIYFDEKNVLDQDSGNLQKLRRDMQIIFQDPFSSLNPRKKVEQIISEGFIIHKMYSKSQRIGQVKRLMDLVGLLPDQINRYPHEFSGGQRQRICIARALGIQPKFIIADEPVSALDVSIQAQILNLLVDLQTEFSLTYLFISHDLSVVRHISDRIAVMYLGRIVELADNNLFYSRPMHPYSRALISAAPLGDPAAEKKRIILKGDVPSPIDPPCGCAFNPRCWHKKEICSQTVPSLTEIEKGHWVSCHFPITNLSLD